MPPTASFTDVRRDFTAITDKVMKDHVQVTVFKHNKPAFKIVPIEPVEFSEDMQDSYLAAADEISDEYYDVFEALVR